MTKITQTIYLLIIMIIPNITQANIEILEYETKNGIKVLYSQSENIPMIDIKITFDAGSNRDATLEVCQ